MTTTVWSGHWCSLGHLLSLTAHQWHVKFFPTTFVDTYNFTTIYEACPKKGTLIGTLVLHCIKISYRLDQEETEFDH